MKCKVCGLFSVFETCTKCRAHGKRVRSFDNAKIKRKWEKDKSRDPFYSTWEWKKLRYKVLKAYGHKCMCCGASPADGKIMVVDHIYPRSKFPKLELDFNNLQVLCNDCNMGKSNDDYTDFRERLPEGCRQHMDDMKFH